MKKRFFKLVALVITLVLCLSTFIGCGKEDNATTIKAGKNVVSYIVAVSPNDIGNATSSTSLIPLSSEVEDKNENVIIIYLDFQGGEAVGSAVTKAEYGDVIVGLPLGVQKKGHVFEGWYTGPDCSGYQITDEKGVVLNRNVLNENIYQVNDKDTNQTITLYAGYSVGTVSVELFFPDGNSYVTEVDYGERLGNVYTDYGVVTAVSLNPSGKPLFKKAITDDMQLYVVKAHKNLIAPAVSCMKDNGYNNSVSDNHDCIALARGWNLGELVIATNLVNGVANYSIGYKLNYDIISLPKTGISGCHDHWLENDNYTGKIVGTPINRHVGYGAYYVKVRFEDYSVEEYYGTNFMASMSREEVKTFCTINKPISDIKVEIFYETARNFNTTYWLGIKSWANYRVTYNVNF